MGGAWSKLAGLTVGWLACSAPTASHDRAQRPGQWVPRTPPTATAKVVAPTSVAAPTSRPTPVVAVESEPAGLRIDGEVGEWDVPVAARKSWSARLAVTPSSVTLAGRLAEPVSTVFVGLELGSKDLVPLVRTREGYRADATCDAAFSGTARGRCEQSVRAQKAKLTELAELLAVEYEITREGVRAGGQPLQSSSAALIQRDGATELELRVGVDDLPWIGELPVREVKLSVSKTKGAARHPIGTLPKAVTPGRRMGIVAEALWLPPGAIEEPRARVALLYRPSETSSAFRSLELEGAVIARGGRVPPMTDPVIVDVPMPAGRTLVTSGDVEIQERVWGGRRVVTSHKAGMAVGQLSSWDDRTSKVRKTAIRSQGIDVLVETIDPGEPGPPENIALQMFRCGADGSVQTIVNFGNAFLRSERFEDATLGTFGIRGKGWRPREFVELELRWIFDPATGTYTESHKGL